MVGHVHELGCGLDLLVPRPRQCDLEYFADLAGPRAHHHDAVGERDRFGDAVGDEEHGLLRFTPDAQQLITHPGAGDLIERTEGLVHEQERGVEDERAGDGHALLHPAGELVRMRRGELAEFDQREDLLGAAEPVGARALVELEGQLDVVRHGAPGQQRGLLEDKTDVLGALGVLWRAAAERDAAGRGIDESADDPQERGLAAARRADERDELALGDVQRDLAQRFDRAVLGEKSFRHLVDDHVPSRQAGRRPVLRDRGHDVTHAR